LDIYARGFVDGVHTLTASETDLAGNTGNGSISFTLKTSALTPFSLALSPTAEDNRHDRDDPDDRRPRRTGDVLTVFDDTGGQGTTIVRRDWQLVIPPRRDGGRAITISSPPKPISPATSARHGSAHGYDGTSNFKQLGDYNGDGTADLLSSARRRRCLVVNLVQEPGCRGPVVGQVGPEWLSTGDAGL